MYQNFSFRFITRATFKLLNSANVRKSIPPWALKDCSAEIAEHLTFLFNAFISESNSQFKQAIVKPIFKKGDSEDKHNYRPISLRTFEVFEKIHVSERKSQ